MEKKHGYILGGLAVVGVGAILYNLYEKSTAKASAATNNNQTAFTGGYGMFCGGSSSSVPATVNAMNCNQLNNLYSQLKTAYKYSADYYNPIPPQGGRPLMKPQGTPQQYMDAMGAIVLVMQKKGCALNSSNAAVCIPVTAPNAHPMNNGGGQGGNISVTCNGTNRQYPPDRNY